MHSSTIGSDNWQFNFKFATETKKFLPAASTLMFVWYSFFNVGGICSGDGARLGYSFVIILLRDQWWWLCRRQKARYNLYTKLSVQPHGTNLWPTPLLMQTKFTWEAKQIYELNSHPGGDNKIIANLKLEIDLYLFRFKIYYKEKTVLNFVLVLPVLPFVNRHQLCHVITGWLKKKCLVTTLAIKLCGPLAISCYSASSNEL